MALVAAEVAVGIRPVVGLAVGLADSFVGLVAGLVAYPQSNQPYPLLAIESY